MPSEQTQNGKRNILDRSAEILLENEINDDEIFDFIEALVQEHDEIIEKDEKENLSNLIPYCQIFSSAIWEADISRAILILQAINRQIQNKDNAFTFSRFYRILEEADVIPTWNFGSVESEIICGSEYDNQTHIYTFNIPMIMVRWGESLTEKDCISYELFDRE